MGIIYINDLILFPILEEYIDQFEKNRIFIYKNQFYFNLNYESSK